MPSKTMMQDGISPASYKVIYASKSAKLKIIFDILLLFFSCLNCFVAEQCEQVTS